jgi:hypothetical protein
MSLVQLRKGMWVRYQDTTGIIARFEGTNAEVHFVHPETGLTIARSMVPSGYLTQAGYDQIPEPRRPDPDRAAGFGYL